MTADVNVTEKVARALWEHDQKRPTPPFPTGDPEVDETDLCRADDALSALADPEVLAGIAGVLREHGWVYTQPVTASRCACGERPDDMAGHQATAVADWLRGRG